MDVPPFALAAFLYPFVLLALAVCVFWPVKALLRKYMRDGKLKSLLLRELGSTKKTD